MTAPSAFPTGTSRSTWHVRLTALAMGAFAAGALVLTGGISGNTANAMNAAPASGAVNSLAPTAITCPSTSCQRLASGLGEPVTSVLDGAGNAYITYVNGDLRKVALASGATTTVARGLGNLRGVDLDGAGGAYVGDFDGNLRKVDLATGSQELLASGLGPLHGIVHGAGVTYATGGAGKLYEVRPGRAVRVVASGLGLSQGIALDAKGLAYTADMMTGRILQTDLTTGTVKSLAKEQYEPTSISVGSDGQVYFAVGSEVTRLNPVTGQAVAIATLRGLNSVFFKVDRNGDAYATDVAGGGGSLWRIAGLVR
ncbi:SMP-30/gluconolactonase/LRE family protein [Streptomyces liangshanensis]|uniref:SMP-30/gluconolactonase/LRE family protein n=1 Tax=Streptomyces liangshanensis TaxID=2717324 RepID=UPI0036D86F5F